jgi:flavin reductase (DIM6/NTAB) family NADH-FMN oxidoreductase RutF
MTRDLAKAMKRCSKPETVALLVVRDKEHDRSNVMPLGWKMWTSGVPRLLAFSVSLEHYSYELLTREGECTLAWPGQDMLPGILQSGSVSGLDTDKFALTGWKLVPARFVGAGLIEGCVVNLECRVKDQLETGDHMLFVCSIIEGHLAEDAGRIVFTLHDEAFFNHAGQGKGYKFGTFT